MDGKRVNSTKVHLVIIDDDFEIDPVVEKFNKPESPEHPAFVRSSRVAL